MRIRPAVEGVWGRLGRAGAGGGGRAQPPQEGGRIRHGASRLFAEMLTAFDPQRLGGMVKAGIGSRLRATEVAPILGQLLKASIAEGRHLPLLDSVLRWAASALDANEAIVRAMVHERAGAILRWTGLDETLADKLIDGLHKLLHDVAEDRAHPLRQKIEEGLDRLAWDLQDEPDSRASVEARKAELIANTSKQR